jgi:hypothetical protein
MSSWRDVVVRPAARGCIFSNASSYATLGPQAIALVTRMSTAHPSTGGLIAFDFTHDCNKLNEF